MDEFLSFWSFQLFHIGDAKYTVGQLILLVLLLIFGYIISKFLENLFSKRLSKTQLRPHVIQTLQRVFFYMLIVGLGLAALGLLNVPLTTFAHPYASVLPTVRNQVGWPSFFYRQSVHKRTY